MFCSSVFQLAWWVMTSRSPASSFMMRMKSRYSGSVIDTSDTASEPTKPCSIARRVSWRIAFSLMRVRSDENDGIVQLTAPTSRSRVQSRASALV